MGWLAIFAVIRHFYFNYNYTDSNLPYIYSLFPRRAKYAIQMVISFLVGGFLAYGTSLKTQVPQAFIIPLITVLSIQDTVGLTLAASFQMLLGVVPVSVFIYIAQKIGLGYHDYVAAEFVLLISAFCIGFVTSQSMRMNEYLSNDEKQMYLIEKEYLQRFRKELFILSHQLNVCFDLWSTFFKLSRSRYHRLFNDGIYYNNKLSKTQLLKQDPYLAELHRAVHRLEDQHQNGVNELLKYYSEQLVRGNKPSRFLPYGKANQNHMTFLAISTIYYSIINLVRSTIDLGTTVHNIFELETTNQYTRY